MKFTQTLVRTRGFQIFRLSVLVLATIAIIAELLPEAEAKSIVYPVLLLTIILAALELKKNESGIGH